MIKGVMIVLLVCLFAGSLYLFVVNVTNKNKATPAAGKWISLALTILFGAGLIYIL